MQRRVCKVLITAAKEPSKEPSKEPAPRRLPEGNCRGVLCRAQVTIVEKWKGGFYRTQSSPQRGGYTKAMHPVASVRNGIAHNR
ncbi:hypothetical protein EYF80_002711 [Liparis tanakae]|uniref:Uncharacterized protein n=1 Tax=Liparis tanakae TaxID=230148 RepID=A0A4Z2J9Q7_9TELE|nr:hypothetical protein EYF80_002711 [Liparis tanakae]